MKSIEGQDNRDFLLWREGSGNTIEIFDIVVGSERRKGIGESLVNRLLFSLPKEKKLVFAITRMSNTIAHEFYEACGFRIVGRLHNFYWGVNRDDKESALMYGKDIL